MKKQYNKKEYLILKVKLKNKFTKTIYHYCDQNRSYI